MIQREDFEWGVQLTTHPFEGDGVLGSLTIRGEIGLPREKKRPTVKITFTGAPTSTPLGIVEAQAWAAAMNALVLESQSVASGMVQATKTKRKK